MAKVSSPRPSRYRRLSLYSVLVQLPGPPRFMRYERIHYPPCKRRSAQSAGRIDRPLPGHETCFNLQPRIRKKSAAHETDHDLSNHHDQRLVDTNLSNSLSHSPSRSCTSIRLILLENNHVQSLLLVTPAYPRTKSRTAWTIPSGM